MENTSVEHKIKNGNGKKRNLLHSETEKGKIYIWLCISLVNKYESSEKRTYSIFMGQNHELITIKRGNVLQKIFLDLKKTVNDMLLMVHVRGKDTLD